LRVTNAPSEYGDPLSRPFWAAAAERRLVVQACNRCDHRQFYPRPFCLACSARDLRFVSIPGSGSVYSCTVVRIAVLPDLPPPYVIALIDLDEGARLLTRVLDLECAIGDRVVLDWLMREGKPPLPVFRRANPRVKSDRSAG